MAISPWNGDLWIGGYDTKVPRGRQGGSITMFVSKEHGQLSPPPRLAVRNNLDIDKYEVGSTRKLLTILLWRGGDIKEPQSELSHTLAER